MKTRLRFAFTFVILLIAFSVSGQERNCAAMDYLEIRKQNDPNLEQRMAEIEAHTQNYIQNAPNFSVNAEILYVPIVVHVVWNSANPVENISDAQILSQVDVIYKDFRRLNEDANDTWSQAADMEIEFYLAQVDPDGNATTGITRTETTVASWGTNDNIKSSATGGVDPWDTAHYFNFWIGNIGGGILGYSSFPGGDPLLDGIVMSPQYFGSSDYEAAAGETFYTSAPYDKGRTTTHEMGHYFNLWHTFQDGTCTDDYTTGDLCADTPGITGPNFGCPTGADSCTSPAGIPDMIENYMDYSDDACMNLFTEDQKARMRATLEAGGPREDLVQPPFDYVMSLTEQEINVCSPADAVFNFTYQVLTAGFSDPTTFSAVGLPTGVTPVFVPATATADGTAVTLTVSGISGVALGEYPFTIEGTSGSTVVPASAKFSIFDDNFATTTLSLPVDGATEVIDADFEWSMDPNATSYDIDIASDSGFATIVESANVTTTNYSAAPLLPVTQYWWRVRSVNDCGTGTYSVANFTTANVSCLFVDSIDTPVSIPDSNAGGAGSVINIPTTSLITDINVTVNITHTWDADLILTLVAPDGTGVILSNRNGSSGDNYVDTVFDQEAIDAIGSGSAPFTGSFIPDEALSLLYNTFSAGDWTLHVSDNAGGDTGTIDSWTLEICGIPQVDTDGDGVPDDSDNCVDLANADQADLDGDGMGDVCDDDMDGDGVLNVDDNCPETANADQADADGDGLGDLCDVECAIFTAIDTPITITTTGGVTYTSVINNQDDLPLDDINVTINIDHTWDSDLTISLQSPSGTTVILSDGNGGSANNYTDTVFDDDAATPITSGSAPFTGEFQPEGSLADFNGESTLGDWTLIVYDGAGGDGGTINLFEIELCAIGEFSVDTDLDGVIDDADNCPEVANADQSDIDEDGLGDVCDDDIDGDGILNEDDNCPEHANPDQADLDMDGIGDWCDVECTSATTEDTPITIADSGDDATYTATVEIMENIIITDVNVTINIDHDWDSDLDIFLSNPNGDLIELSTGNGGAGDNYTDTVFDQDADASISSGTPPFTGSFIPEGDLSSLNGDYSAGVWTLVVTDTFGAFDGGVINSFTLEVCGILDPYDYDVDGVLNEDDNCLLTVNPDQSDIDGDGQGDLCDDDMDGDGVLNVNDNCPGTINPDQSDIDGDGLGDICDNDMDGDGSPNSTDNCPETYNLDQSDLDGNGIGDVCDGLIPNDALTPNGDGINDAWMILNIERFPNAVIKVFNRWGNEVFSTNNYSNNWKGTSDSGGTLPTGSYFYQIDQSGDGNTILHGWIYLTN